MKQRLFISLLSLLSALYVTNSYAAEYLVKYKDASALMSTMSVYSATPGVQVMGFHAAGNLMKVDVDNAHKARALAQLLKNPNVEYVNPNFTIKAFTTPVGTETLKEQWAIAKVQAEKAWQRAGNKGSRQITVAVIDTGADYNHESLKANMVAGYDFADNDNDPMDKTSSQNPGHGTHCSGIIGATGLVDGGTVGISPEVSIMPLRFLTETGQGTLEGAVKAIDYAISKNVQVISASWGAAVPRDQATALIEAIKRADDKGVIFVAAAANDGKNNDTTEMYPANSGFPNTITVAASDSNDAKPSWSNYGKAKVHVASPGLNIMSTLPSNKYGNLSGTSMATPLVSGLVAFLKAQDPKLTGAQIRSLLQTTGAKVNIETACNCRIDAYSAVDALLSKKLFVSPAAGTLAVNDSMQFEGVYGKAPFKFASSNPSVATISDSGALKAVANGKTTVTVTDSTGAKATSLDINVGASSGGGGGGGGGGEQPQPPGGGDGSCPIGDQSLCDIICQLQPDLPFCQK